MISISPEKLSITVTTGFGANAIFKHRLRNFLSWSDLVGMIGEFLSNPAGNI